MSLRRHSLHVLGLVAGRTRSIVPMVAARCIHFTRSGRRLVTVELILGLVSSDVKGARHILKHDTTLDGLVDHGGLEKQRTRLDGLVAHDDLWEGEGRGGRAVRVVASFARQRHRRGRLLSSYGRCGFAACACRMHVLVVAVLAGAAGIVNEVTQLSDFLGRL